MSDHDVAQWVVIGILFALVVVQALWLDASNSLVNVLHKMYSRLKEDIEEVRTGEHR